MMSGITRGNRGKVPTWTSLILGLRPRGAEATALKEQSPFQGLGRQPEGLCSFSPTALASGSRAGLPASRWARMRLRGLPIMLLALLVSGCVPSSPTYPFDIFPEMHYSPAYRPQEPPRLLPADGAVPVTGRAPQVDLNQARQFQNPIPNTPENSQRSDRLYQINCRPCHGPNGRGDGFVASYFRQAGVNPPVDYAGPEERALTDGEIFAIIGNGFGAMPPFGNLLTEEERWLLVKLIRSVQAQNPVP